jgi:hypothetical protein
VVYKVISKILIVRLSRALQDIIGPTQNAFLGGRNMIGNINLAQEFLRHYGRKKTSLRCLIKVDFRKAFDSVHGLFSESFFICWVSLSVLSILLCYVWKLLPFLLLSMAVYMVSSLGSVELDRLTLFLPIYFLFAWSTSPVC